MPRAAKPKVATRDELLILLTEQARRGRVDAIRLLLAELKADGIENGVAHDFIDELAVKREVALGA